MSRRIEDLAPDVQDKCKTFLAACAATGNPMIVVYTYRSFEEQAYVYAKGRSLPGPIVSNAPPGHSWHNFRRAFDVAFYTNGALTWTGPWHVVGDIGRKLGLLWGGDFTTIADRPHFEYHPDITLEMARARDMTLKVA